MRLQEFMGTPNRVERDEPRVTLNSRGVILLNYLAFQALGSPAAVKFFFDENELVIVLKPADLRHRNAFPLKVKGKNKGETSSRFINGRPFCLHHEIRVERTVLFHDIDIDKELTMLLWLKKTIRVGRK